MKQSKTKTFILYAVMAFGAMIGVNSCSEDDLEKAYDDKNSLDSPYIFSEGYQDSIVVPYDLAVPPTDWLGMVKDETKVCKLSIPGTHDTMTGMGFYQPVLKFIFNMTAISQVSTLDEQIQSGLRFFDIRPVVSTDTIAKKEGHHGCLLYLFRPGVCLWARREQRCLLHAG